MISALYGGEWLAAPSANLTPGMEPPVLIAGRRAALGTAESTDVLAHVGNRNKSG
jgi:hypothetical protein